MEHISLNYEIIVYCNGSSLYCKPVLDYIERDNTYFAHRLYQTHILFENSSYAVKLYDFIFSEGRNEDNTVIVEANVATYLLNMHSGVPISPFDPSKTNDMEFIRIAKYLDKLATCPSITKEIQSCLNSVLLKI